MMPACPHCGKKDMLYVNVRVYGWVQRYYNLYGEYCELDLDKMKSTDSKIIRCAWCGNRRKDLVFNDVGNIKGKEP